MRFYRYAFLIVTLLFGVRVYGDSWSFEKRSTDKTYQYGNTKIVMTRDATKDQKYPDYILQIYYMNELSAQYRNVAFEHLFASPDNNTFIGLSNSGLPGTAVVFFGKEGELRLEIKHNIGHFEYCEESSTVHRVWYDAEKPDVKFVMNKTNDVVENITLRDCNGKTVSLFDIVDKAYNKTIKPTP